MTVRFFVPGEPQSGGSKRAFAIHTGNFKRGNKGQLQEVVATVVSDSNPKAKGWKSRVADACRDTYHGPLLPGPLRVRMTFTFSHIKGHYGTGKNKNTLKAGAPFWKTTKPDHIKLARPTEDALTKVLWVDDSQLVDVRILKCYGVTPGVEIEVEPAE